MAVRRLATCLNVKVLTKPVHQPSSVLMIKYSTVQTTKSETSSEGWKTESGRLDHWLSAYENFVGLTEVRDAQQKVLEAELRFSKLQDERRRRHLDLNDVQSRLRGISSELEKVHRGEERYLALLTQEHAVIKEENRIIEEIRVLEEEERSSFSLLSSSVRDSHEKERARAERTKYWSLIGSAVGAVIGIVGTSINNYLRMRELRGIVTDSTEGGIELRGLVTQLSDTMKGQHNQVQSFISDLRGLVSDSDGEGTTGATTAVKPVNGSVKPTAPIGQVESHTKDILELVKQQDSTIKQEMKEIKDILALGKDRAEDGESVYVGPIVENMLQKTESNLESKMKFNALRTVVYMYGGLAIGLPVLYIIFRGGS